MNPAQTSEEIQRLVRTSFKKAGLPIKSIQLREFPGETIVVVEVSERVDEAVSLASTLDPGIVDGFITVRHRPEDVSRSMVRGRASVHDPRVTTLIELLNARSRTSEAQPSLRYVQDASERLRIAVQPRHHLIFGRRGVGKTALMLETRRRTDAQGNASVWINVHTIGSQGSERAFLSLLNQVCSLPEMHFRSRHAKPQSVHDAAELAVSVNEQLNARQLSETRLAQAVIRAQKLLALFCTEIQGDLFIFLDDVHQLRSAHVPRFLDRVHAITRDNPVWLKVAGVKHQTRWYSANPPIGLQIGHDATEINLDITLEEPTKAKTFLENVLDGYVATAGLTSHRGFLAAAAIDRLVLASGGVPRDFLTLCASSVEIARQRQKARQTGVQDVNTAAGLATKSKLQELEEDATAAQGSAAALMQALQDVRAFLLDEKKITFLRVDLHDKERHPEEYALIQGLMDLRMLHIISSSLSDRDRAGRRSEVYMLDLSQYSGRRLKQNLNVLDFAGGFLILKKTRSQSEPKVGNTARKLITILRGGPEYLLSRMEGYVPGGALTTLRKRGPKQ